MIGAKLIIELKYEGWMWENIEEKCWALLGEEWRDKAGEVDNS